MIHQRDEAVREGPVLVTGAAGFIGSNLVDFLSRSGRPVIAIDRRQPRAWPRVGSLVRYVTDDLCSMDIGSVLDGVTSMVHLAARPGVRPSWTQFDDYVEANIRATRRLLEACAAHRVRRLVIASSSSVYGNRHSGSMAEDQPPAPISPYAVTKLASEQLALAYAARPDSQLTAVALRFFTVYGPGQRPDMLISRIISAVLADTEIRVFGDGSQRRDFVFVGDAVRAIVAALRTPGGSRVYNVGTGRDISVSEVIGLIGELLDREPRVLAGAHQPGDVPLTRANMTRAAEALGFRATMPLREGLRRHIEAVRRDVQTAGV